MNCARAYRVVAEPWRVPTTTVAADSLNTVGLAELELRERLEAGETPQVILVGPEWGAPAQVGPTGELADVWAWTDPSHPFATNWLEQVEHCSALLEAHTSTPDPASPVFSDAGSVLIHAGRLQSLHVARWLRPVAEQIADLYGVPVYVSRLEPEPAPKVDPAPAVIIPNLMPAGICAELARRFRRLADLEGRPSDDGKRAWSPRGGWDQPTCAILDGIMEHAAVKVGLPVNGSRYGLMAYTRGQAHPWHTDRNPHQAKSAARTVSFSVPLTQVGEDYTGGDLVTETGRYRLNRGDVCAFTATTRHAVDPVMTGERIVLIGFGEYVR